MATLEATALAKMTTCADIEANWGRDWPAVLEALEQLIAADEACGEEPLLSKKYATHYNYAAVLESEGNLETAIGQYRAALAIDPQRKEALDALFRLQALPEPTPAPCRSTSSPRPDPAPTEAPDLTQFVTLEDGQLQLNDRPFKVKGVNYYPRQAPWKRFLTEADPAEMAEELDLIQAAGFNTLRVFLWYEPLFTCRPEDAIPNEAAFETVDTLFNLADERDLKLIVTLNDLPDLTFRPLYTDWAHYDAQTVYLVRRYRNEPAILAWDLRNEGDLDYGAESLADARFSQAEVVEWVAHLSDLVRQHDPHRLITTGWWGDPTQVEPSVDFLSFHHWTDVADLEQRLETYRQASSKPLLLEEVGYHSWAESPEEPRTEQEQADILSDVVSVVEADPQMLGWVVWAAFDFVPEPGQPLNPEHYFGLWRTDLSPKPALEALPLQE